ncbi:MAG: nuclease-related domain-containing protein [Acidimicrobiia bacterium]
MLRRRQRRIPDDKALQILRESARRNKWIVAAAVGATLVLASLVYFVATVFGSSPGARGFMVGSVITALVCFILWLFIETSGARSWIVGGLGEGWTSEELRKLGPEWVIVESISLGGSDIDHVAIGPPGVFVIDSKFVAARPRPSTESPTSAELEQAQSVARQASRVHLMTKSVCEQTWVRPVVVEWGPAVSANDNLRVVSSVEFVAGQAFASWRTIITARPTIVSPHHVIAIAEKLERQKRTSLKR